MKEELIKFVEEFFKSLNARTVLIKDIMKVDNVPSDFQLFYGKKEPYFLAFEEYPGQETVTEQIKPSSFIISCMKEYLKTKGQTTLINLIFDFNIKDIIGKFFSLKNCELSNLTKKETQDFLIRFSFQTNFQYQNQRDQENHQIYIYKGQLVKLKLEEYKYSEGKNSSILIDSLKKDYDMAKAEVKSITQPRIEKLSKELDEKLDKELRRINEHFSNQKKEIENKVEELEKDIIRLEKLKATDENVSQRIAKAKHSLSEIKDNSVIEKLRKEEEFFINDEKHKHSLNISTKLINTTIISYPLLVFTGYLKNKDTARVIEMSYNPLLEKLQDFNCDCCKKPIKVLSLCSSGHLVCDKCLRGCSECGKDYCNNCLTKSCFSCGKKLCRKCAKRCSKCLKDKCSSHMSKLNTCVSCEEKSVSSRVRVY